MKLFFKSFKKIILIFYNLKKGKDIWILWSSYSVIHIIHCIMHAVKHYTNCIYDSRGCQSQWGETDDSDKVSEVGHVGQDVGEADDELSEIDDNEISEADTMTQWVIKSWNWWMNMSWMRSQICEVEDS